MRFLFACFLVLSILFQGQAVRASGEWTGFWKLVQQSEEKDGVFYLWVSSEGRLGLFDKNWMDLHLAPSDSRLEDESLKFSQYLQGGQVVWTGQRQADSVEGKWEFLHLQYQKKGSFSGTRISAAALTEWAPVKAADSSTTAEGILNLTASLQDEVENEESFRDYWEGSFLPRFLPFFPDPPDSSSVQAALMKNRETEAAREFEDQARTLSTLLKRNFPTFEAPYRVVIVPVGEGLRQAAISENAFLLINPDKFVQAEDKKLDVSRKLLAAQLYPYTRRYTQHEGSVFKIGLELFLLEQAYPEELSEVLSVSQKRLATLEKKLPEMKDKLGKGKRLKDDERRYLSLCFARALVFSYSFQQVVKSPPPEIAKRLVEFIHVTGSEPVAGSESGDGRKGKKQPSRR